VLEDLQSQESDPIHTSPSLGFAHADSGTVRHESLTPREGTIPMDALLIEIGGWTSESFDGGGVGDGLVND
jgi:hypothetical protein